MNQAGLAAAAAPIPNPALYNYANTPAFNDITGNPRGQGVAEATVFGRRGAAWAGREAWA